MMKSGLPALQTAARRMLLATTRTNAVAASIHGLVWDRPLPLHAGGTGGGCRTLSTNSGNGASKRSASTSTSMASSFDFDTNFDFVKIPSLPLLGSMIPWHSGIPPQDLTKLRENTLKIKQKFGHFNSMGVPGLGAGSHGTLYGTYTNNNSPKN